jgi:hypothetical protein
LSKKGNDRENQKAEVYSIEAGYDLEVSPREYPAFVVRREIASRDSWIDFRAVTGGIELRLSGFTGAVRIWMGKLQALARTFG